MNSKLGLLAITALFLGMFAEPCSSDYYAKKDEGQGVGYSCYNDASCRKGLKCVDTMCSDGDLGGGLEPCRVCEKAK